MAYGLTACSCHPLSLENQVSPFHSIDRSEIRLVAEMDYSNRSVQNYLILNNRNTILVFKIAL